jgi:hypothetical protein
VANEVAASTLLANQLLVAPATAAAAAVIVDAEVVVNVVQNIVVDQSTAEITVKQPAAKADEATKTQAAKKREKDNSNAVVLNKAKADYDDAQKKKTIVAAKKTKDNLAAAQSTAEIMEKPDAAEAVEETNERAVVGVVKKTKTDTGKKGSSKTCRPIAQKETQNFFWRTSF